MSKYKPLTEPITRREACLIVDRKRFDGAVRSGQIERLGKRVKDVIEDPDRAPTTAPLLFDQEEVREFAKTVAGDLARSASDLRADAKQVAKQEPPLTRRHVDMMLGKKLTGILIRSGVLAPYGKLTDTQTAAHTYNPIDVATVLNALAEERVAESRLLARSSKVRVLA